MRFGIIVVPIILSGCKNKSDDYEYVPAEPIVPNHNMKVPEWTTDPTIANAFSRMLQEQRVSYISIPVKDVVAKCPPTNFKLKAVDVSLGATLYPSDDAKIWFLTDKTKLIKTVSPKTTYLEMVWREKAVLSAVEKMDISPRVAPKSSISLLPGCEIRSYVMDMVPGESLIDYVNNHGSIDAATLKKVGKLTLKALEKLHNTGIVHGDMHRGNIIYNSARNEVKLIDYGRAEAFIDSNGKHLPFKTVKLNPELNPLLLSIQELKGYAKSRADDIFRLAEMLVTTVGGMEDLIDKRRVRKNGLIYEEYVLPSISSLILRKQNKKFAYNVPQYLRDLYNAVVRLDYGDTPDYEALSRYFD